MTFVNLSLLGGTALIALPIVLHLIMRQKPKRLEFPALRFIQKRSDVNRRRLLLRHILLLLLRAAAIALLACALARPSIHFSGALGSQEAPVAAALVFDTAPRMEYRHENLSRLQSARELGLWLLAQLPSQSQIAVLDTRLGPGTFQVDRGAAKQRIERLQTVAHSQPLPRALDEALRLVGQSELERKEVYVFSDLARGAWPADSVEALQSRLKEVPHVGIYVIDVGVKQPVNYSLGELRLSGQVLSNRSSLRVETELSHTGPAGDRTVELYLLDNKGNDRKRSEQSYALDGDQSQQVEFHVGSLGIGTHQGFVRIVGQDGLACDDTRYFSVEVKPAWKVLVAAPDPPEQTALFLFQALAPTEYQRRGEARFDCHLIGLSELSRRPLDEYAAVCLLDPTPLEPAEWKKLADFAADGHGVAVFLGRNARPAESFNTPVAQDLLAGKLLRQARAPDGDVFLAPGDYQHPILSEFRRLAGAVPWQAFPVFRYWEIDAPRSGVGVVVPYSDRRPALLERPLGKGRALMMTTPVSDRPDRDPWNLLPVGQAWPFGILVHGMMLYLVGSGDQQLNYYAGQTAVLQLDPQQSRSTYQLFAPGEDGFPLSADLTRHLLVISATDQAGNYRVQAGGTTGVDRGFSVNLAPEQTELRRVAEEDLDKVFGPYDYRVARTRQQIERDFSEGRVGRELFSLLILMTALILAAEHFVANRFYRQ
ncbi:MAG: BatA domain-containing protein [Pirellulales bacterium]|nr:BatA domain-containing protein [Pirellulales bacterium]